MNIFYLALILVTLITACATPPSADPSTVEPVCGQQCSSTLATCSSGFKAFPIVQQKQCNDNYDVCISGCPARKADASTATKFDSSSIAERLDTVEELFKSGAITHEEYETKRKEILGSL